MNKYFLLLFILTLVASAQVGSITGFVTNAQTGNPIAHALVEATGPGSGQAYTCQRGGYQINNLPSGYYQVTASATGYEPQTRDSVLVHPNQTTQADFALQPVVGQTDGIDGFVTDAQTGNPIPRALVIAHGPDTAHAYTCNGGYFRILNLTHGIYSVTASAPGYEPYTYDSILVQVGETTRVNFALQPTGTQNGAIGGFVTNAQTGMPIAGALVVATGPGSGQAYTCQRGGYLISDLVPGYYQVHVSATGYEPQTVDSILVHPGQVTRVNFELEPLGGPTGELTGFVTDAQTGNPIHHALVQAIGPGSGQAYTCQYGGYRIRNLVPGYYQVTASATGYEPQTQDSVLIQAGQTTQLDFSLNHSIIPNGNIEGFVTDAGTGNPIVFAMVRAQGPGSGQTHTDTSGYYFLSNLPVGLYRVTACASGYVPQARCSIEVTVNETTQVDFALECTTGTGGFSGIVLDAQTRNSVPWALVTTDLLFEGYTYTDANGNFLVENIPVGDYVASGFSVGYDYQVQTEIIIYQGQITGNINFTLPSNQTWINENKISKLNISKLKVTPNPSSNFIQINFQIIKPITANLSIYDATGKLIATPWTGIGPTTQKVSWDSQDLRTGVYFIKLKGAGFSESYKVIITK